MSSTALTPAGLSKDPSQCGGRFRANGKVAARHPLRRQPTAPSNPPMIPHLKAGETPLKTLGWRRKDAKWIALVCLHGGLFIRSQYAAWRNASAMAAVRFVRRLVSARVAVEETVPAISPKARLVRICSRHLYQAIGATGLLHRRIASKPLLLRRLLSPDYVLEHPALPWLPTEAEKVRYCRHLGLASGLLPNRLYGGAAGGIRRFFNARMPIDGDHQCPAPVSAGNHSAQ